MRTVYPYTEHHENPISHPSIASAVSRDRAARTSTTGPNCEKKLRTTPTTRTHTQHTAFVSHVPPLSRASRAHPPHTNPANPANPRRAIHRASPPPPSSSSRAPRDRASASATSRIPRIHTHPSHARTHAPSSTVRSSPPTNIFDPAEASVMESPMRARVHPSGGRSSRARRAIEWRDRATRARAVRLRASKVRVRVPYACVYIVV